MTPYKWHEDPKLANLYQAEVGTLTRGLGGEFELVKLFDPSETEGRIVAVGNLVYGDGQKQAIQIIFPTKYPYAHPRVLTVAIALGKNGELTYPIQPINLGKGNQYGDGAMCLFEKSFWNRHEHNIGWLLRRAQKWLRSANSPTGFKLDEIVDERAAPLAHIGQVLIPKKIVLPDEAETGEFVLNQFKPNHYILVDNQLTNSPFQFHLNKEVFRWYRLDMGVTFKTFFPVFNAQAILDVFQIHFGLNVSEGAPTKNVALYMPGDDNLWHFFKFIVNHGPLGIQITFNYLVARTLDEELYLRISGVFDYDELLKKRVTIIGLGAVGSEVARSLSRNGIGHFNLFDSDTFEVGNLIRHAADLFFVGDGKVDVAKALIQRSNPNITVNTYRVDVLNDAGLLEKILAKSDLCLVLTGEDAVDYMINDQYVKYFEIPFVFARLSAGAMSGSIQIVDKNTPCLRCLSATNRDQLPKPKTNSKYTQLKPEFGSCSTPPLPGSEIDSKEIAQQVSRIALQLLLPETNTTYPKLSGRQFYWHGPFGSDTAPPFSWEIHNYGKYLECNVCKE